MSEKKQQEQRVLRVGVSGCPCGGSASRAAAPAHRVALTDEDRRWAREFLRALGERPEAPRVLRAAVPPGEVPAPRSMEEVARELCDEDAAQRRLAEYLRALHPVSPAAPRSAATSVGEAPPSPSMEQVSRELAGVR